MTCSDFLTHFSEYHDGELNDDAREPFRRHLSSCASCRRYERVVLRGRELLRSSPPAGPSSGFRDRLQHSILALEEDRRRKRIPGSSSGLTTFALAVAVVAAVIMAPVILGDDGTVALPPIVVEEPSNGVASSRISGLGALGAAPEALGTARVAMPTSLGQPELWSRSNALLYQHSSLYSKHREPSVVRAELR